MFNHLALISIPVSNQKRAKTFYTKMLGCKVSEEMPFGDGTDTKWIRLEIPGIDTALTLVTWFPQMKPGGIQGLVITTKDIEKTHAELKKRGLDISPVKKESYAQEATFRDPDGNGWVLQQKA